MIFEHLIIFEDVAVRRSSRYLCNNARHEHCKGIFPREDYLWFENMSWGTENVVRT